MERSNVSTTEGAEYGQKPDTREGSSKGSTLRSVVGKKTSTPDRLRVLWILAVAGAVLVSVVVNLIVGSRGATTDRIASDQVSVIVGAQQVQTSIAEADAAAANEFLADGEEEQEQRLQYQASIEEAGVALTDVASKVDDDEELLEQVKLVEKALVKYSGLIESARANNRQNYPIGAAYLSAASGVLDQEVYPSTDKIANGRARQYRGNYNDQVGTQGAIYLSVLAVALLALLIFQLFSHRYLSRKFRRTINVPYAIGIFLTVGVIAWGGLAITAQNSNVRSARQDGYENVRTLINLRAQGLRAKSEESQYLIARGAIPETSFAIEADKVTVGLNELAVSSGNGGSSDVSNLKASDVDVLETTWATYQSKRAEVLTAATTGERDDAIALALSDSSDTFQQFDADILALIDANIETFDADMDAASSSLRFLSLVGPLLLLIGSVSIYFGMQQRIREYR